MTYMRIRYGLQGTDGIAALLCDAWTGFTAESSGEDIRRRLGSGVLKLTEKFLSSS